MINLKETREILSYDEMNELVNKSETLDYVDETIDGIETRTFGYNLLSPDAFENKGARNCRGMMFEKESKKLIALPFFKFFNYNENETYSSQNIKSWKVINVYDKVDGSLIYFYRVNGKLFCRTQRMYNNVQSLRAMEIVNNRKDYKDFILNIIDHDCTPMFELLSPDIDPHIIRYNFTNELVFLGMRNMKTGELTMPTTELYSMYSPSNEITTVLPSDKFESIKELINFCMNSNFERKDLIEGYTVLFDNNELIKFKTQQFFQIHQLRDSCTKSDINIVRMIFDGTIDDALPEIEEDEIAKNFVKAVMHSVADTWSTRLKNAERFCEEHCNLNRKEFYELCLKELDSKTVHIAMKHFSALEDPNIQFPAEHKGMIESYIASREWRESPYFSEYAKRFESISK